MNPGWRRDLGRCEVTAMMPPGAESVQITFPPYSEYLRTVRLVAADAAGRAGLDVDEVEDFRIAVDELCHLLMSGTDHSVTVAFGVHGACVLARGTARGVFALRAR